MLGGEHKRERVSERLQNLNNQPGRRGYLPGCHMRATDAEGRAGYSVRTLQGNWSEERRDAAFSDDTSVITTDLGNTWKTTYQTMAIEGSVNSQAALNNNNTAHGITQKDLVDIVDGRHRCYPGHQPLLDPQYAEAVRNTYATTTKSNFVNPAHITQAAKDYVPPVLGGSPDAQAKAVIMRVKHKLLQRSGGSFSGMRRSLVIMDTSGDGSLNSKELLTGLARYRIELSPAEISVLMKFFDKNGSGVVEIGEFCRGIRGDMSNRRKDLVKKAYTLLDANGDGVVRLDDIATLYDVSNHPDVRSGKITPKDALKGFMADWDTNGDEVVEFAEFMDYYENISATIDNDRYFELMMRNTWHISGGEGACANTSCRRVLVTHNTGRQTVEEIKNDLGIGAKDIGKMKANLVAQGITDIARIELYA